MPEWADANPLVVGIAGDWHANADYAKSAIEYAKEQGAQAILHVGDIVYDLRPGFLNAIQDVLERTGLVLGWVDGNHDQHTRLRELVDQHGVTAIPIRPSIFYLPRTYRWDWNGIRFLALGGAHSVDRPWRRPHIEWWPGETISYTQAQQAIDDGRADVMICHDVPARIRIPAIEGNPLGFPEAEIEAAEQHRELLKSVVDEVQPRYLFAGHYHCRLTEPYYDVKHGYRTWVNILADDSAKLRDNTVVVDLSTMEVDR